MKIGIRDFRQTGTDQSVYELEYVMHASLYPKDPRIQFETWYT